MRLLYLFPLCLSTIAFSSPNDLTDKECRDIAIEAYIEARDGDKVLSTKILAGIGSQTYDYCKTGKMDTDKTERDKELDD